MCDTAKVTRIDLRCFRRDCCGNCGPIGSNIARRHGCFPIATECRCRPVLLVQPQPAGEVVENPQAAGSPRGGTAGGANGSAMAAGGTRHRHLALSPMWRPVERTRVAADASHPREPLRTVAAAASTTPGESEMSESAFESKPRFAVRAPGTRGRRRTRWNRVDWCPSDAIGVAEVSRLRAWAPRLIFNELGRWRQRSIQ